MAVPTTIDFAVPTARGEAEVTLDRPPGRLRAVLMLGHGAGGGVDAPDLKAVRNAAVGAGIGVARITQPYRVAGKRVPPAPSVLDEAWKTAVRAAQSRTPAGLKLLVGGRSSGARVACRTAAELGAIGVLALAFPLHPPGRPQISRGAELDPQRPTLVINGDRDPFGLPQPVGRIVVRVRPGEGHDLRRDPAGLAAIVLDWLADLI